MLFRSDAYDSTMNGLSLAKMMKYIEDANAPKFAVADRDLDTQSNIRIVGPAFFPVQ